MKPKKVAELLKAGADIHAMDEDSLTALHIAVIENHLETVKILLEAGAGVNAKDWDGRTPQIYAKQEGYNRVASFLKANT